MTTGTSTDTAAAAEVCPEGTVPTGCAVPMTRTMLAPAGCVVVRREVVWALAGGVGGAILMYWLLNSIRNSR